MPPAETNIESIYPLTPLQEGLLFECLSAPAGGLYVVQAIATLEGTPDAGILERACRAVLQRHPVLRTAFHWKRAGNPLQVVRRSVKLTLLRHDWRDRPGPEQRLQAYLDADRAQGFDLSRAPLTRMHLIRVEDEKFWFVWTCHHILVDGWSLFRVLPEIWRCYDAFSRGEPFAAPAPRPYREYIGWLQRQDAAAAEAFWRRTLEGFRTPTSLVPLPGGPLPVSRAMAAIERDVPPNLSARLQACARRQRVTLSTIAHAAWMLVVSRYSGSDDVAVGTVMSGRPPTIPDVDQMVGLFVNTVPFRMRIPPDVSVGRWLQDVQARLVETREYEYTPVARVQRWSGVPPEIPLFDIGIVFENYPQDRRVVEDAAASSRRFRVGRLKLVEAPVSLFSLVTGWNGGLWVKAHFDSARLDRPAAERVLATFEQTLEDVTGEADRAVGTLGAIGAAEQRRLVQEWNPAETPLASCMHEEIERQVAQTPDVVAVVDGDRYLTYAALNARANQLARHLIDLGAEPERLVALLLPRSLEVAVAMLASWKAGAAYLPLDVESPADRLRSMLEEAAPACIISAGGASGLAGAAGREVRLDAPEAMAAVARRSRRNRTAAGATRVTPANLAYVIYTSGSTGRPKGVMVTHGAVSSMARAVARRIATGVRPGEIRMASCASVGFDATVGDLVATVAVGGTLLIVPEGARSGPALRDYLAAQRITQVALPPVVFETLGDPTGVFVPLLFTVADTCTPELVARWAPGRKLVNSYGPTETTVCATMADLDPSRPPSIGTPLTHARVFVLDRHLHVVPIGTGAELCIGGAGVARGYLKQPALTAGRFVPDPFSGAGARMYRTGDLARWRADGELEFLGRLDHQVKVRGFRVECGEVEAALHAHPGVRAAAVVARDDAAASRQLAAYVVLRAPDGPTVSALRDYLQERLPLYMIPAAFVVLPQLPLTPHGKVDRRALPAPAPDRPALAREYAAPRTAVEQTLAAVWQQVLRVSQVGVHDNFFELGGDSILAIQVMSRAAEAGLHVLPRDLFQHPTIARLATHAAQAAPPVAEQGVVSGPAPLTPIQRWFFARQSPDPHHFNQAHWLSRAGGIDASVLVAALEAVVRHHDALRLRFRPHAGGWVQEHTAPPAAVPVTRVDLTAVSAAERPAVLARTAQTLQTGLHLTDGPLLRAALCEEGPDRARVLLVAHHLVIDVVSWRILLEDLETAYSRIANGLPVQLPPKTTSFKVWAERLQTYASSGALSGESEYWTAVGREPAAPLPLDGNGENTVESSRTLTVTLTAAETEALLQEVPRAYRTQMNDALLAALAHALGAWTGRPRVTVAVEAHGREPLFDDVDLSRTVGWFTTTYPVVLDLTGATDPGEALKRVKEELRRVPRGGIGYGILRYLASNEPEPDAEAQVSFNYLGQTDSAVPAEGSFHIVAGPCGSDWSPRQQRPALVAVNAMVQRGQLITAWTYSGNRHAAATIAALADRFISALRRTIEHCVSPAAGGYTPSDFPLATLTQRDIDRHLGASRGSIEDVYPLTPMQQEMLVHALASPGADLGFVQTCCRLSGDLDVAAFRRAWQAVSDTYAALRTSFIWEDLPEPLQVVHRGIVVPWDERDWRAVPAPERRRRLRAFLAQDRRRGFDLSRAPLSRLTLIAWGPDTYYFVLSGHHVLLDGWSQTRVLDTAFALYERLRAGGDDRVDPETPFRDFVAWIRRQDLNQAERFWRARLAGLGRPTPIVQRLSRTLRLRGAAPDFRSEELRLSDRATADLAAFARGRQLTINAVVQGAWALVLSAYTDSADVVFGTTVSGRAANVPGIASIVGLCINMLPVRVPIAAATDVVSWIRELQMRHAEAETWSFVSRAQLESWKDARSDLPLLESAVVVENHPEDARGASPRAGLSEVQVEAHAGTGTGCPLTVLALPGPPFSLVVVYDGRYFTRRTIAELSRNVADILEAMVAHPDRSPQEVARLSGVEQRLAGRNRRVMTAAAWDRRAAAAERVLRQHPTLAAATIQAAVDEGTARLIAYVVPRDGAGITVSELRTFLACRVPAHAIPEEFVVRHALPRTCDGEVDRARLVLPGAGHRPARARGDAAGEEPLELEIAAIWERILNVRPIGPDDQFFGLGGDSLRALRMIAAIKERFDIECPLSTLLHGGTVRDLARALRDRGCGAPRGSTLSTIRHGPSPGLFVVHAAGGNVLSFVELARAFQTRALHAFQSVGLDGSSEPLSSLEEMAYRYIAEMRSVQPHGPYMVGGFSFGGFVAFEMAHQLRAMGQAVGLLALLDTWAPVAEGRRVLDDPALECQALVGQVNVLMRRTGGWTPIPVAEYAAVPRAELVPRLLSRVARVDRSPAFLEHVERLLTLHIANGEALRRYRWPVYDGRITVFRAVDVAPLSQYVMAHPALGDRSAVAGWAELSAEPLEIIDVPGTHQSMMEPPHVAELASRLEAAIGAASERREALAAL